MLPTVDRIRELNDEFRQAGPGNGWFITPGVEALGSSAVLLIIAAVVAFDRFERGNDPYHEHDFGSIDIAGHRLFWKIDYYDLSFEGGSPDPSDPGITRRVLTIMLASEY